MKEITREEFTTQLMQLIYFAERLDKLIPECEMKTIYQAIETIKYWSQFAQKRGDKK